MKNLKSISVVVILLISTILFINCEKESIPIEQHSLTPELIGKIHNKALDNILNSENKLNFNVSENEFKSQIIKESNSFLSREVSGMKFINDNEQESIKLLNTNELILKNFNKSYAKSSKSFSMEESNIFDKINFLHSSNIILDQDKKILDELYTAYKNNYQGSISDEELLILAKQVRNNYTTENTDFSKENVFITLSIIEICVNSLEWFDANIDTLHNKASKTGVQQKALIWNIVAADAVGAIVGVGLAIIQEGIRNGTNGPVDGESIIYGAVEGAVTGSVGSVVKAAGWLSKLF